MWSENNSTLKVYEENGTNFSIIQKLKIKAGNIYTRPPKGQTFSSAAKDVIEADGGWITVTDDGNEVAIWPEIVDAKEQYNIGLRYSMGDGVMMNWQTAAQWYRLAAHQGDAEAQFGLGSMYRLGEGVMQDGKEAAKWYRLAAEQGNAEAQFCLGWLHVKGESVIQDKKEAIRWWRLAAEQGDERAQFCLGNMYYKGKGVIQDYKEAYFWYLIAAANGIDDAKHNREIVARELSKQQQEQLQARAKKWFNEHN